MIIITNDDASYLSWIGANPTGFVVNAHNPPKSDYLKLHRASCADISSSKRSNWTTTGYLKVCSNEINELETWAIDTTGGRLNSCQRCKPGVPVERRDSSPALEATVPSPTPSASHFVPVGEDDLPFRLYPGDGRQLLGKRSGGNSRRGYGLTLQRITGQTACTYCGVSLVDSYEHWLLMQVDHVVPSTMGKRLGITIDWMEDYSNMVLACSACNTFENQFDDSSITTAPTTESEFFDLRDLIFRKRKPSILRCQSGERGFFDGKPWEQNESRSDE